jgi:3-hydroxybutyrate dehydrogenase
MPVSHRRHSNREWKTASWFQCSFGISFLIPGGATSEPDFAASTAVLEEEPIMKLQADTISAAPAAQQRPLEGRVALVTGSTSGIGLGVAESLAAHGARLVLNGFGDPRDIARIKDRIAFDHSVPVIYSDADLSDANAIIDMMRFAAEALGDVDILVNNAGIQHVSPVEAFPEEKWDAIIAINLSATFHLTKAVFKGMKDRGFGRIINIASAHALVASPFKSAYVAAKHGVMGFTKTVALEGAEFGVTCNAICPGYVKTPLVEKQIPDTARARGMKEEEVIQKVILEAQPTKKFVTVEEIGALAVFLSSDKAASITGAALQVDGGWVAK